MSLILAPIPRKEASKSMKGYAGMVWGTRIRPHDVLCGRGNGVNSNEGNVRFRKLVKMYRDLYAKARRQEKVSIAMKVIVPIQDQGGRFLRKNPATQEYKEISRREMIEKVCQCLREYSKETPPKKKKTSAKKPTTTNPKNSHPSRVKKIVSKGSNPRASAASKRSFKEEEGSYSDDASLSASSPTSVLHIMDLRGAPCFLKSPAALQNDQEHWNEMFQRLEAFKKQHGHCGVPPPSCLESNDLSAWASLQRQLYREVRKAYKVPSPMDQSCLQRLEDIGFVWDFEEWSWQSCYKELRAYLEVEGHCADFSTRPSLGRWLRDQHQHYLDGVAGRAQPMLPERVKKMKNIVYGWGSKTLLKVEHCCI